MLRNKYFWVGGLLISLVVAYESGRFMEHRYWHKVTDALIEETYQDGLELGGRNQKLHDTVREGSSI